MTDNFNLKKFLTENRLTTNAKAQEVAEEKFYAPDYIAQKYGNKAKEIEQNIHDAEEAENNPNLWDHFTSLETPGEVDDFIQGFIDEGVNENTEVEEVTLGNTRFAVEEPDPIDDGTILSISKHKNGYFIIGEVRDQDGDVKEAYGYGVDFDGNVIEGVYDEKDLDGDTAVSEGTETSWKDLWNALQAALDKKDDQESTAALKVIGRAVSSKLKGHVKQGADALKTHLEK